MTDNDFLSDFWRKRHEALLARMRAASLPKPTLAERPTVRSGPVHDRIAECRREYGALLDKHTKRYGKRENWPAAALAEVDTVLTAWAEARDMLPKQPEPHNEYCIRCGGPVYDGRDMCLDCRREEEER